MSRHWVHVSTCLKALTAFVPFSSLSVREKYDERIEQATNRIKAQMAVFGIPGLSVAVSIDGHIVWKSGFGFANIESYSKCTSDSVMRIASISKSITAVLTAQLVDRNLVDLDSDITKYLPEFPSKRIYGEDVIITLRCLLSHTAGIRHYDSKKKVKDDIENPSNNNTLNKEFLSNKPFANSVDALKVFKDDDLIEKPGQKFSYSTYGFTVVGAILEKVTGKTYQQLSSQFFEDLGMRNTQVDRNEKVINGRVSYYQRNNKKVIENCSEVDCSNKFPGGGIVSNTTDLLIFANAFLFSLQCQSSKSLIAQKTAKTFISQQIAINRNTSSGLGWFLESQTMKNSLEKRSSKNSYFYHSGAAVGASSIMLISPSISKFCQPSGFCVVILCNLQDVSLLSLALAIRDIFES